MGCGIPRVTREPVMREAGARPVLLSTLREITQWFQRCSLALDFKVWRKLLSGSYGPA